jgi:hypothetical protein
MSKRNTKRAEPAEQVQEEQSESVEQEVHEDVERQPQQQNKVEGLRICISCGSSANLYKSKVHKTCIECLNLRPGKSEKQLESFKRAREKRMENISRRKQEIAELERQAKEELDKKIVSKAISIKKKLIKQNAELDTVSDDDTPLEEVMKIAKKKPATTQKPKAAKKQVSITEPVQKDPEPPYQQPQYIPQVKAFNFL